MCRSYRLPTYVPKYLTAGGWVSFEVGRGGGVVTIFFINKFSPILSLSLSLSLSTSTPTKTFKYKVNRRLVFAIKTEVGVIAPRIPTPLLYLYPAYRHRQCSR